MNIIYKFELLQCTAQYNVHKLIQESTTYESTGIGVNVKEKTNGATPLHIAAYVREAAQKPGPIKCQG